MRSAFVVLISFFGFLGVPSVWASDYPDRNIDVTDYELSLNIPFENSGYDIYQNTLEGKARISLINTGDKPLATIPVLLYRLMKADAVADQRGKKIAFTQKLTALEGDDLFQVNYVEITLKEPLPPGAKTTFEIAYHGALAGYTETGMLYVRETLDPDFTIIRYETFVYPTVLFPVNQQRRQAYNDAFNQTIRVTVPSDHIAANAGDLIKQKTTDGMSTFEFKSKEPRAIIIMPIAKYGEIKSSGNRILYLPDDEEGAQTLARAMDRAMALMTGWFGPLQTKGGIRLVEIPEWYGSQNDFPLIIQTADAFRDQPDLEQLYHELSHLWNVSDPDPNPARWNEGLATFLQGLVSDKLEEVDNRSARENDLFTGFKSRLKGNENYRVPMKDYGKEGVTGLAYRGGGLFFSVLYEVLGEDTFLKMIGDFYQKRFSTGASTDDFLSYLHSYKNPVVDRLVHDWFETADYFEIVLDAESFEDVMAHYRAAN